MCWRFLPSLPKMRNLLLREIFSIALSRSQSRSLPISIQQPTYKQSIQRRHTEVYMSDDSKNDFKQHKFLVEHWHYNVFKLSGRARRLPHGPTILGILPVFIVTAHLAGDYSLSMKQQSSQWKYRVENIYFEFVYWRQRRKKMKHITYLSPGAYNAVKFVILYILVDNLLVWARAKLKRAVCVADSCKEFQCQLIL